MQAEASIAGCGDMDYPTVEDFVGNTPLCRLQRLCSNPSNTILCKLEGNNPAGSVKDRCGAAWQRFAHAVRMLQATLSHHADMHTPCCMHPSTAHLIAGPPSA